MHKKKQCIAHRWVALVDDLPHEVGVKHSLCDDGEPRDQMTHTQSEQLFGHLQHGHPEQTDGGLGLVLLALRVPAGVGVPALVSRSRSVPLLLPLLHLVDVVHAAGRFDEERGVGAPVAVAVGSDPAVVGEGAGRLSVEGVASAVHGCVGAGGFDTGRSVAVEVRCISVGLFGLVELTVKQSFFSVMFMLQKRR